MQESKLDAPVVQPSNTDLPRIHHSSKMDAMLKNIDKDTLKKGADTVVDKAAEQLSVDAATAEKAKGAAHNAIDKADIEQLKAAVPQAAEAMKNLLDK